MNSKKIVSFNVNADSYFKFKEWCETNGYKMSPLVEDMLNEFLATNNLEETTDEGEEQYA
jgi:hypothetical protein